MNANACAWNASFPANGDTTMKTILDAKDTLEANLVKGLLQQQGIAAYIRGEYLQGGIGELPPMGMVQVQVAQEDVERAEKIILAWEAGDYAIED